MLEDRFAQHDKIVVDKFHDPVGSYIMNERDYVVRPHATGATGPVTITLPPVANAKGRFYSILVREADVVNSVTIVDNNSDSECWLGDVVFYEGCAPSLWYSDGLYWHMLGAWRFEFGDWFPKPQF